MRIGSYRSRASLKSLSLLYHQSSRSTLCVGFEEGTAGLFLVLAGHGSSWSGSVGASFWSFEVWDPSRSAFRDDGKFLLEPLRRRKDPEVTISETLDAVGSVEIGSGLLGVQLLRTGRSTICRVCVNLQSICYQHIGTVMQTGSRAHKATSET